jgi:hypothetical protein
MRPSREHTSNFLPVWETPCGKPTPRHTNARVRNVDKNVEDILLALKYGHRPLGKAGEQDAWNDGELFLPLSRLKDIKGSWYDYLDRHVKRAIMTPCRRPMNIRIGSSASHAHLLNPKSMTISRGPIPLSVPRRHAANMAAEYVLAVIDDNLYLPCACHFRQKRHEPG